MCGCPTLPSFLGYLYHTPHNYSFIRNVFKILTFSSWRLDTDLNYIFPFLVLIDSIGAPNPLFLIPYRNFSYNAKNHQILFVSIYTTPHKNNKSIQTIF